MRAASFCSTRSGEGFRKHDPTRLVEAYNVSTRVWTKRTSLPYALYETNGALTIAGKIYVSGGAVGSSLGSGPFLRPWLFVYNPKTNSWTQKRSTPSYGWDGVSGVISGKLYVLTYCYDLYCDPVDFERFYRYDPVTDQWSTRRLPPNSHRGGTGAVIGGKFYVVGGSALDV